MVKPATLTTSLPVGADGALTPAMRQWADQKAEVPDALLLFRMGDFYETFHEDAEAASRALGLTLTTRDKGIPLAGIPYHALDQYLPRLVKAGFKIAISEQTEDARKAKGLVRREIVRVITPGTLTEDHLLEDGSNNYLAALCAGASGVGAACLDLGTGDFFTLSNAGPALLEDLVRLAPAEVLIPEQGDAEQPLAARLHEAAGSRIARRAAGDFDGYHALRRLTRQFEVATLEGFGYREVEPALLAAGAILAYLEETQKACSGHIVGIRRRDGTAHLHIDPDSWRALEIERTLRSGSTDGSLFAAVNRTHCALGARRLRAALRFPLSDVAAIAERQEAIAELTGGLAESLAEHLRRLADIERITARLGLGRCSPRDLVGLGHSLRRLEHLRAASSDARSVLLLKLRDQLGGLEPLAERLEHDLLPDAPLTVREGGIFRDEVDAELQRLRELSRNGRQWLARYQAEEIERSGIAGLKVGFNKVFGYYIEISHSQRGAVPAHYVRKQTVKNAERYITDELKRFENEVLTAQDQANELEARLFEQLKRQAAAFIPTLLAAAEAAGTLDMLAGFAELAAQRRLVRPVFCDEDVLDIVDGRHPVLEQRAEQFVPNDTHLDPAARLLLITGPNMAGKSTYIRQVALLTLLAHTGCFVPARSMRLGICDRVFARVGASDELARGQSTFMVEMVEAANILNNATPRSLVILDELGRGTSTYDGLALAWAICEHIVQHNRCRTLFATHYHELTELARLLPGVRNYNVAVREWPGGRSGGEQVVFLHKIVPGTTDRSYGVHVARIAGIPPAVIERSRGVLAHLESGLSRDSLRRALRGERQPVAEQLELFGAQDDRLRQALLSLDVDCMTPLDALQTLKHLQDQAR